MDDLNDEDSPHPRGWTQRSPHRGHRVFGFPAPAGMDPPPVRGTRSSRGIPRTRGDGPQPTTASPSPSADSPHPRGWTRVRQAPGVAGDGFPAPAGMDRARGHALEHRRGIPRTRGDGPRTMRTQFARRMDSPHPRGWTLVAAVPDGADAGIPRTRGDGPAARPAHRRRRRDSPHPRGWTRASGPTPAQGRWIPRTRGDGPRAGELIPLRPSDSPHPRGWTRDCRHGRRFARGFPAPAGMDPRPADHRQTRTRIPRTRGDGPAGVGRRRRGSPDSPHPRGWTRPRFALPRSRSGFPAPAGMDRAASRRRRVQPRIPRTRGDGPVPGRYPGLFGQDSPHPRGWTPRRGRGPGRRHGFPAPAGMDPGERADAGPGAGIPRTRGDGPLVFPFPRGSDRDSPHPRGWTRAERRAGAGQSGFPAPAGMDPGQVVQRPVRPGIPRTRGDGPRHTRRPPPPPTDSPHPRGWTQTCVTSGQSKSGFPAPAGMDLGFGDGDRELGGIPRTRGDGPGPRTDDLGAAQDSPHPRGWTRPPPPGGRAAGGFPAPAGMDPVVATKPYGIRRIPRTRGDGPWVECTEPNGREDSPHPRGWTPLQARLVVGQHGFPAPAGMDRSPPAGRRPPSRIPRTRGDGPGAPRPRAMTGTDSPHPRGWTRCGGEDGEHFHGFPAPAGMDPRPGRTAGPGPRIPRTRGDGPDAP